MEILDLSGCKEDEWARLAARRAHGLGRKLTRVNAIPAGTNDTREASGIEHFDELPNETSGKSALSRAADPREVGRAARQLASDYTRAVTGGSLQVDAGFHIGGMGSHGKGPSG